MQHMPAIGQQFLEAVRVPASGKFAQHEGESTDRVIRPTPLGMRCRLQVAGLCGASQRTLLLLPERVNRSLDLYVRMVEAAR
jgi:hypothetical protein